MAQRKDRYREFMERVKVKRMQGAYDRNGKAKIAKKGIESIVVQRVNSQPIGKTKKFEPLDTRDLVDFSNYDTLTILKRRARISMEPLMVHVTCYTATGALPVQMMITSLARKCF